MASTAYLLQQRAKAIRYGDVGQVRAINADLARLGHVDTPRPGASGAARAEPMETTELAGLPERAVPSAPRRRRSAV